MNNEQYADDVDRVWNIVNNACDRTPNPSVADSARNAATIVRETAKQLQAARDAEQQRVLDIARTLMDADDYAQLERVVRPEVRHLSGTNLKAVKR